VLAQAEPAPAAPEKTNPTTTKVVEFFAEPLADGSIVGFGKLHRWLGRQPNEPDPEWMDKYRTAVREVMAKYLPDAEMTPEARLFGCLLVLNMGMWIGARELEQPKPAQEEPAKPTPLKLVKSRKPQEPESWPEKAPTGESAHAATLAGVPSSAESDLSSLPPSSAQMTDLQPDDGAVPGADPCV
jgi:hypothetical protein